jgi:uncharacterized cupin superfamily protein
MTKRPFVHAPDAPPRVKPSNYPAPFAARMEGRVKRPLGDMFGLSSFGVNLCTLAPGAASALLHAHSVQDEMVFVLSGRPTLVTETGRHRLSPGDAAGFPASGEAHHLVNETEEPATLLEIGDRRPGDSVRYPADDLEARLVEGAWTFARKDGGAW